MVLLRLLCFPLILIFIPDVLSTSCSLDSPRGLRSLTQLSTSAPILASFIEPSTGHPISIFSTACLNPTGQLILTNNTAKDCNVFTATKRAADCDLSYITSTVGLCSNVDASFSCSPYIGRGGNPDNYTVCPPFFNPLVSPSQPPSAV
jgi:hypothetical protein